MKRLILLLSLLLYFEKLVAQSSRICGKVSNVKNENLAFASIADAENPKEGTLSNINGAFYLNASKPIKKIICSYIGYEKQVIEVENGKIVVIILKEKANDLGEVIINAEEDPAKRLMKRVIKNQKENNPEEHNNYQCTIYNKINFEIVPNKEAIDSLEQQKPTKGINKNFLEGAKRAEQRAEESQLFLTESVSKRTYQKPKKIQETVMMNRVSGLKEPLFAALANQIQPFSFYGNRFRLLDKFYHSPVSQDALNLYNFSIQDTLYMKQDTIYSVLFSPQKNKAFEALKGVLFINTKKNAIQNVKTEPAADSPVKIKIEQQYQQIRGIWFPEQLNFLMIFEKYPNKYTGAKITGKSFITNAVIDSVFNQAVFNLPETFIEKKANLQADSLWDSYRLDSLSRKEKMTYLILDSVSNKYHFDRFSKLTNALSTGVYRIGNINIDLANSIKINQFEGFRLGIGLSTNAYFSKRFSVGAYTGLGLKDNMLKYGAFGKLFINEKKGWAISGHTIRDIQEVGKQTLWGFEEANINNFFSSRFDAIQKHSVSIYKNQQQGWAMGFGYSKSQHQPYYDYNFGDKTTKKYQFSELATILRYRNTQANNGFIDAINQPSKLPNLDLFYARGITWGGGDYNYNKVKITLNQNVPISGVGFLRYQIEGGFIDKTVPYMKLFTENGVTNVSLPRSFKTVQGYEFVHDKYASIFLQYDFPKALFANKYAKPMISLVHNFTIGTLQNSTFHTGIPIKTSEKGLFEAGLEVRNLLKLNYFNAGKIGVGLGIYGRYGAYQFQNKQQNFVFSPLITFSFN